MEAHHKAVEVQTDKVTTDELDKLNSLAGACNGQAFNYMAESDNDVVVKDVLIEGSGIGHCFVYDKTRDVVLDACMRQFSVGPDMGAWDGETHPYAVDFEEVREWQSEEDFKAFYDDAPENDFIY